MVKGWQDMSPLPWQCSLYVASVSSWRIPVCSPQGPNCRSLYVTSPKQFGFISVMSGTCQDDTEIVSDFEPKFCSVD